MSDLTALRSRGIPIFALVDGSGIAKAGTATLTQLRQRGMRPICQVDGTGTEFGGSGTATQLRQRGIETFCAVDETGVDADGVTLTQLRQRGIKALCWVNSSGIAATGSSTMSQLQARGIQPFCPLDENGNESALGAVIVLSASTQAEGTSTNTTIGDFSVVGGSGSYTFAFDTGGNPDTLFSITSPHLKNAVVFNYETGPNPEDGPSHIIHVTADNGVDTPLTQGFTVSVTNVDEAGSPIGLLLTLTKAA